MSNKNYKAYKYRLCPTIKQIKLIDKTIDCTRFIYNKMLEDKISYYKKTKQTLYNTPAQYKKEFPWLREVDSSALCNAQMNLQKAYGNFFSNTNTGFPKFKSKKVDRKSYTTNSISNSIRIEANHKIKLPKLGLVNFIEHRQIPNAQKIKSATISKTPTGKYYISVLTECKPVEKDITLDKEKSIGLDYSSSKFYIDNQGVSPEYPRFFRLYEEKLAREQRKLSHMKLGSRNYKKQKLVVAKVHEKISSARFDFIHKLSTQLANTYDYICIEDISMKNLSQTLNLGKSTMDNSFGMFRDILNYKLYNRGKKLIKIDKWFPSSKTCNDCGYVNKELKLTDRDWICPNCGTYHERDINAAKNILEVGLSMI